MPHLHVRMKRLLSKEKKVPLLSKGQVPNLYAIPPVPAEKGSATNEASPHQNPNSRRNDDPESKLNPTESSYFSTLHRDMHSKAATSYFQSTFPVTQRDMNTDKYSNFSAASGSRSIIHQYSRSPIGGQHEINTTTQQCWAPNTTKEIEGFGITTRITPYFRQHLTSITDLRQLWSLQQQHTIGLQRSSDFPAQLKAVIRQQTNLARLQAASSNCNSRGRRPAVKKTMLGTISSSNMQSLRALPSALLAQNVIEKWGDSLREGTQSESSALRASNFVLSPRCVIYHVPKCMEDHNQSAQTEVRCVDNGRIKYEHGFVKLSLNWMKERLWEVGFGESGLMGDLLPTIQCSGGRKTQTFRQCTLSTRVMSSNDVIVMKWYPIVSQTNIWSWLLHMEGLIAFCYDWLVAIIYCFVLKENGSSHPQGKK